MDKPFGKLANDAIIPFKVKTHSYSSVVNYVYANLLPESTFKEEMANTPPKNILKTFEEIRNHLKQSTIQSAAYFAISQKAKQDGAFLQSLMETDNYSILYYSQNNYLGVGRNKEGENIYGQALVQHRNELQSEKSKERENEKTRLSYIAEVNLRKLFHKNNLEKYISKDKNRSIGRLVEALIRDLGKTEIESNAPDTDTIIALYEKRNVLVYNDPNSLIRIIRKNEVRNVLKKNMFELKNVVVHYFVDYILSKNVTVSEDKMGLKDQLFDILPSKREEFANRLLDLYSAKALPTEVNEKVKRFKAQWYFPTEKDIEFFETENIKLPEFDTSVNTETNVFKLYYDHILSPLDESSVLVINNFKFKSISHYIAFELNKLYGQMSPEKLYTRMKNVRREDLEQYNKMLEKDIFTTYKNKLLEDAINIKRQDTRIKNLLFCLSFEKIEFEDDFNLNQTEEIYNRFKDKTSLTIRRIPSFEQFVEKDSFIPGIVEDKVDFYFMILNNLMVHMKSKHKLQVSYEELVDLSPFYSYIMIDDASVVLSKMPEYLIEKNKEYGLSTKRLLHVWSIIFNGMKQTEKIIGKNSYDIRYKNLLIWSKYFLSKPDNNIKTFQVMQSIQEDAILITLMSILSKLKQVNLQFNSHTLNIQDLQTAIHLCLGKVRVYKHELAVVEDELDFEEEDDPYDESEIEVYDDEGEKVFEYDEDVLEYEGFDLNSRMKFEVFLNTYFNPLKNELNLKNLEDAVYKILNSKIPITAKHQNLNFFNSGYKTLLSEFNLIPEHTTTSSNSLPRPSIQQPPKPLEKTEKTFIFRNKNKLNLMRKQ